MQKVRVDLDYKYYNIYIDDNLFNQIPDMIRESFSYKKVLIITDDNVSTLYLNELKKNLEGNDFQCHVFVLPAGESSKSMNQLSLIYDTLIEKHFTRKDLIIALGGGVVGDISGYAAATYLRGIDYIQIPTTLLSQVDSSVGGKVAVNVEQGKNLIGSFYHPKAVYIDVSVLRTLPKRELISGMAEVIKYAFIKDEELFNELMTYDLNTIENHFTSIITQCIKIKSIIVQQDEKEAYERMLLNFGHTVGHAIERQYRYEKYNHGEAVGIGIRTILLAEYAAGMIDEDTKRKGLILLDKYHLYMNEALELSILIDFMKLDKKSLDSSIQVILLKMTGKAYIKTVSYEWLYKFLQEGLCSTI